MSLKLISMISDDNLQEFQINVSIVQITCKTYKAIYVKNKLVSAKVHRQIFAIRGIGTFGLRE